MKYTPAQKSSNDTDVVSLSIAQDLARNWINKTTSTRSAVIKAIAQLKISVRKESSPKRGLKACLDILCSIETPCHTMVTTDLKHSRLLSFESTFMGGKERSVIVSYLTGSVNWRTRNVTLKEVATVGLSLHSIARLVSRLRDPSGEQLLAELASGLHGAESWLAAGRKAGATCWPLLTKHGVLVAAEGLDGAATNVITWLAEAGISAKWRAPLETLRFISTARPEALESEDFKTAFIRAHPFMLHEHQREESIEVVAKAQEAFYHSIVDDNPHEPGFITANLTPDQAKSPPKPANLFLIGLNYKASQIALKRNERSKGIVVTTDPTGMLVIGLENGLIARIPATSANKGRELIPSYVAPSPGDVIEVLITSVNRYENKNAVSITAEPIDVYEASWAQTKEQYVVGSLQKGALIRSANHGFLVHIDRYFKGRLRFPVVSDYFRYLKLTRAVESRQELSFKVAGFDDKEYLLILDDALELEPCSALFDKQTTEGDLIYGVCSQVDNGYVLIRLPGGLTGVLHALDSWGHPQPNVGDEIAVRVFEIDAPERKIKLERSPPRSLPIAYLRRANTSPEAKTFFETRNVGDIVSVQVRGFNVYAASVSVCTEDGVIGAVHWKEVSWCADCAEEAMSGIAVGEIRDAIIKKMRPDKELVFLSFKPLVPDPTDLHIKELQIGTVYEGVVRRCLDYGYFVRLRDRSVTGLLHKSEMPLTLRKLQKGDIIEVEVKTVDPEFKKVSLSFQAIKQALD